MLKSRRVLAARVAAARATLAATVTPLASIFGSGFLIIVPVLERTLGALSVVGALAVCAVAWLVGTAIRHCVRVVEPLAARNALDATTVRMERTADAVIVVAYVISVALYLRIMAQYVVAFAVDGGSAPAERIIACAAVAVIVGVGILRGFHGLDVLERISLAVVLLLVIVLGGALLIDDTGTLLGPGLDLPPVPQIDLGHALAVLGGILIAVQGFETVRYLSDQYDAPTRIRASRVAQGVAAVIYVGFVALATPRSWVWARAPERTRRCWTSPTASRRCSRCRSSCARCSASSAPPPRTPPPRTATCAGWPAG